MTKISAILTFITLSIISFSAEAKDKRTRINVLDTGITPIAKIMYSKALCSDGHSRNWIDPTGRHGSNVVGLIAEKLNTKKFCIEVHNILGTGAKGKSEIKALAKSMDAKYINMSFNGKGELIAERSFIKVFLKRKIHVFVAAGNSKENLDIIKSYPAAYNFKSKYWHVVGSSTGNFSNFGRNVTELQDGTKKGIPLMTGTSQSTPIALNKLVRGIK